MLKWRCKTCLRNTDIFALNDKQPRLDIFPRTYALQYEISARWIRNNNEKYM